MKLALYLPNFRDKATVAELEDLTNLAEHLDFDSVWTLDRIVVPGASDRQELQFSFGMMEGFPKALPVSSRGEWLQGMPLLPWLAAKTTWLRIGMSITDTPYRAPRGALLRARQSDQLSSGRLNVGVGSGGGCPRNSPLPAPRTSSPGDTSTCARRSRSWSGSGPTTYSSITASSPTSTAAGSAPSRCRSRTRRSTSAA